MNVMPYHATRKVDQAVETEIKRLKESGVERITVKLISEAVDCSPRTVLRSLQRLSSGGRLHVIFNHGCPNQYELGG